MRCVSVLISFLLLPIVSQAMAGDVILTVSDPDGIAAQACAPVSVKVDSAKVFGPGVQPGRLRLVERFGLAHRPEHVEGLTAKQNGSIPAQLEADGTLWWLMPPEPLERSTVRTPGPGERRFQLTIADGNASAALTIKADEKQKLYDIAEGQLPVLRYNQGTVPVSQGIDPKYARGDYIFPLYGLAGENLTDDYPKDHPHHRGVWWSWPVTRWGKEVRDIWAVRGVWARPVAMRRAECGPVMAVLEAENVWKWGDKDPIVREEVVIRAFRQSAIGRYVDIEVRLTALADGVAIGGRPHGGYGGFSLRAAPVQQQVITVHLAPSDSKPVGAWLDYSGIFAGDKPRSNPQQSGGPGLERGKDRAGVAILEHISNPDYPNPIRQYPNLNCVMPAFPCEREVPLAKDKSLVLKHRLWIHSGGADEKRLAQVWASYAMPPMAKISE